MKLTACMIVKNEEVMLSKTLSNLVKSVDEVVMVDTGSTDATVEIAKKNGVKLYHFDWIDDFSAARNESLKHATGDWIIWIDADEFVEAEDFKKLKDFLAKAKGKAYNLFINECPIDSFNSDCTYFKLKVFKNGEGIRFEKPINENIYSKQGSPVVGDGVIKSTPIYHWGNHKSEADMQKKCERNIALLKKGLAEQGDNLNYHFILANNYKLSGLYEEAIAEFDQAIALKPREDLLITILTSKAGCLYQLKRGKEACQVAIDALKRDQNNSTALNIIASVFISLGKTEEAVKLLEQSRSVVEQDREVLSLKQRDYIANLLLGDAYKKLGKEDEAKVAYERAYAKEQTEEVKEKLGW
jgi:tetratricopeptide (TPR) repeat protein